MLSLVLLRNFNSGTPSSFLTSLGSFSEVSLIEWDFNLGLKLASSFSLSLWVSVLLPSSKTLSSRILESRGSGDEREAVITSSLVVKISVTVGNASLAVLSSIFLSLSIVSFLSILSIVSLLSIFSIVSLLSIVLSLLI